MKKYCSPIVEIELFGTDDKVNTADVTSFIPGSSGSSWPSSWGASSSSDDVVDEDGLAHY
jgi:hypothetical protein